MTLVWQAKCTISRQTMVCKREAMVNARNLGFVAKETNPVESDTIKLKRDQLRQQDKQTV